MTDDRLTVPTADGGVLLSPSSGLADALHDNRSRLREQAPTLCGVSASQHRERLAEQLGCSADDPVVLTGHQPEFYHPGVWIKQVLCQQLADAVDGVPAQILVDHDHIKHRALALAVRTAGGFALHQVPLPGFAHAESFADVPPWSSRTLTEWSRALEAVDSAPPDALLQAFVAALHRHAHATAWVEQQAAALAEVNAGLGLHVRALRSTALDYSALFGQLLADAPRFAEAYNAALAHYRASRGIRGNRHPIPDLLLEGQRVELPLWAQGPNRARQRVFVSAADARLTLWAGDRAVYEVQRGALLDGSALHELREPLDGGLCIRPRALILTLYLRLFASDLFVHGIGGAKYDHITDLLIRDYFGLEPPRYAVTTATLQWAPAPAADGLERRRLLHTLRDMQFNPQRHGNTRGARQALIQKRAALVDESQRLRERARRDRGARHNAFTQIRALNDALSEQDRMDLLRQQLADIETRSASQRVAGSREFFFCLYASQRLEALKSNIPLQH